MGILFNPFYIIDASPEDSKARIHELIEEKKLLSESDEYDYDQIYTLLTNPKKRISAEITWCLDTPHNEICLLIKLILNSPKALLLSIDNDVMSPLAKANIIAAGFANIKDISTNVVEKWLLELSSVTSLINTEDVRDTINMQRKKAGFSIINDINYVSEYIDAQYKYYRNIAYSKLDMLSSEDIIQVLTNVVEQITDIGENPPTYFIKELVKLYETEVIPFLDNEKQTIKQFINEAKNLADKKSSKRNLNLKIDEILDAVENWDTIAQPMQVITKAGGSKHQPSVELANLVRNFGIYLYNNHNNIEQVEKINNLLYKRFIEVGSIVEILDDDAKFLNEAKSIEKYTKLIESTRTLCINAVNSTNRNPVEGIFYAKEIYNSIEPCIVKLKNDKASAELILIISNECAMCIEQCIIIYCNNTGKYSEAADLLLKTVRYITDKELRERVTNTYATLKVNNDVAKANARRMNNSGCLWLIILLISLGTYGVYLIV